MNKSQIITEFIKLIEHDLMLAIQAQKTTVEYATGEENKAENQYDTRGLEASYLARGQAERVADLRESLAFFKMIVIKSYHENDPIGNTAFIEIVNITNPHDVKYLLMMPKGGGLTLNIDNKTIQVVTASSPLGKSLLGKNVNDEITYQSGNKIHEYEIISIS